MSLNLKPDEMYRFIVTDFEDTWNSVANNPSAKGRGNFLFALHGMILLEFASRVCVPSKADLNKFAQELCRIEAKYFTTLPGFCWSTREFTLPHLPAGGKGNELLWAAFDLIRNGMAHQYQQISVQLNDGNHWAIELTGAEYGRDLGTSRSSRDGHLKYYIEIDQSMEILWLRICPDVLFLDLRDAIDRSGILSRITTFPHFTRPSQKGSRIVGRKRVRPYDFDMKDLERCLNQAGHLKFK